MWGGVLFGGGSHAHPLRAPNYKSPSNKERKVLTPVPKSTDIIKMWPQL